MIGMWAVDGTEVVCLRLILLIRARIPKRTISAFCSHCPPPDPLFTLPNIPPAKRIFYPNTQATSRSDSSRF
jgi:hypothetical protein